MLHSLVPSDTIAAINGYPQRLQSAFIWMDTPEGHDYWDKISKSEELPEQARSKLLQFLSDHESYYTESLADMYIKGYRHGLCAGIEDFAIWKDGKQWVGALQRPLKEVLESREREISSPGMRERALHEARTHYNVDKEEEL